RPRAGPAPPPPCRRVSNFPLSKRRLGNVRFFAPLVGGLSGRRSASSIVPLSARDRALEALDQCPLRGALRAASRLRFRRPPPLAHLCCRRTSTCDPGHPARSAPVARLLPLP